eukprot:scaffold1353_cov363-Pavlova_lutheri.AAC.13
MLLSRDTLRMQVMREQNCTSRGGRGCLHSACSFRLSAPTARQHACTTNGSCDSARVERCQRVPGLAGIPVAMDDGSMQRRAIISCSPC